MTAQAGGAALLSMNASADRNDLRRRMRARRRDVSDAERRNATRAFAATLSRSRLLTRSGLRVAAYLAHGSEADPSAIVAFARERGARVHLPVISSYRKPRLDFVPYPHATTLRLNRFGIREPVMRGHRIHALALDVIFVPLLAVDPHGFRLGSGLGFYDRRLAHLRAGRLWRRPRLIGVAYEFQRIEPFDHAPWDVPLDGLLTERSYRRYPARGDT